MPNYFVSETKSKNSNLSRKHKDKNLNHYFRFKVKVNTLTLHKPTWAVFLNSNQQNIHLFLIFRQQPIARLTQ